MNDAVSEIGIVNYLSEYLSQTRLQKGSIIISDRSVFDLYTYITTSRPKDVRDDFVRLVKETVIAEICRTSMYVYVPIEFPLIVDEVRPENIEYQKKIDRNIVDLLTEFNANKITVTGTPTQRVEQVVSALVCVNPLNA